MRDSKTLNRQIPVSDIVTLISKFCSR